jgi:hypothetical protein
MNPKYKLALKVAASVAPVILALVASYAYDIRPIVRDVCEVLLPFGSVMHVEPSAAGGGAGGDAGAAR